MAQANQRNQPPTALIRPKGIGINLLDCSFTAKRVRRQIPPAVPSVGSLSAPWLSVFKTHSASAQAVINGTIRITGGCIAKARFWVSSRSAGAYRVPAIAARLPISLP
jgi:hypothetical protein